MVAKTWADKANRIFVSNLAWKTSYQDVKELLKTQGLEPLRVDIFRDGKGSSRGCGIAILKSKEAAAEAIKKINGKKLNDRTVVVREDQKDTFTPKWDPRDRHSPARKSRNGTRQLRKRKRPAEKTEVATEQQ